MMYHWYEAWIKDYCQYQIWCEEDSKSHFNGHGCSITKNGQLVTNLKKRGKLYELRSSFRVENTSQANVKQELELWHVRLGIYRCQTLKGSRNVSMEWIWM